ncbi:hypothetical protein [Hoeflea phototrophica]|jgi:hypothetical protein|nr:hypothetical protein [Hoeflea phototrophica]
MFDPFQISQSSRRVITSDDYFRGCALHPLSRRGDLPVNDQAAPPKWQHARWSDVMMKFAGTTRSLTVILPALIGLTCALALPQPAFATFGGDGDRGGQGDRPQRLVLTTDQLLRLNKDTLLDVSLGIRGTTLRITGPLEIYYGRDIATAVRHQPDRARRLIERLERAKTEEEKEEIIEGLLQAAERRHKASDVRLKKEEKILKAAGLLKVRPGLLAPPEINNNERVQAYYALLRATYSEERYAQMLDGMLAVHTGKRQSIFDLIDQ